MAITTYQPSNDPFATLFDSFLSPLSLSGWNGGTRHASTLRAPAADVAETENDIKVMVEMPGVRPEAVDVSLEGNVLTITGEKREERVENDERNTWHLSERRYGRFSRSFVLPRDVEQDRIDAQFDNGVLYVTVPKSERARRRRIEIRSAGEQGSERRIEAAPAMAAS